MFSYLGLLLLCASCPSEAVLLRQWLRGLQISVPNFEISQALSKLGVALNITGGRCRGLELEEFQLVDGSADPHQMAFTLQLDMGIHCLVNTTLQAIGPAKTCELEMETAAAVARVGLQVPVEHGLPGEVSATCALQPDLTKLHVLTRSLACEPLRLVERGLQEFINDLAPTLLCAKVSSYLTEWLSEASKELRDFVSPFLKPADVLPIPAAAKEALDLRKVFWKGPMGHVLRSFLREVIHVENATRLDQVLGFLQQDLGLRSWLRQRSWEAHVPWIQDMFLSLWMQNASVNLTSVEELHFQFSGPAAARLSGAISPTLELTATTAVHLDKGTAKIKLRGYEIEISQDMPLSPVELQLQANFEVIAAGTAFVAYNGSGLQGLQFDQMQRASCASAYLVQNEGQPMQLLEARCAPQVRQLQVVLPHLDLGDLELEVLEVVQKFMQLIGVAFNQSVPEILDGYVSQRGRAAVNEMLQKSLSQSSACPASNFSSGELRAIDVPAGWTSVLLLVVTMVFLMVYLAWLLQLRKQERAVSHPEALEHGFLPQAPSLPPGRGLGWQPGVPCSLRWGMLCGIGGTTFLFVYASVTPGVLFSGSFEASKDGSSATKHMASLSMENSLVQTLQVGSYFVFAAMLIFSVIWPYIKLLMMVYVWAAPVDPKTRGPVLLFLDRIGKWSLMDNIILFLFISFFWIAWIGEDVVSGGSASFGLKCSPGIELNTFLAATILSLLLGHAMLWVHRWYCPDDGGSVSPTTCSRPDRHRLRILGLAQVICILLTVLSWQLEVVDVAFGGLVGTFLKVTDQPTSKTYSIMGLLSRLGKQGSTYLQVTFAVFVLIIPLLYLLAMAFLCLYQLQPKKQQLVLRLCYTLNAWAAYDVFFIAFLAAVLGGERYGIGQFIELVVYQQNLAPMCDALRDIGVQCMHVQLALLPGAQLILLAVVASFLVSLLATRKLNKG